MINTDKDELLIGLVSDTHVPTRCDKIPEVILKDFKERNVDYVFHMGDFVSIEIYDQLIDEFGKDKVFAVIGNMDAGNSELKNVLPEALEFELFGHKIYITHGSGGPSMIIRRLNKNHDLSEYDIIIFGHTHHPMNQINEKDGKLYLNPGTCTPIDGRLTVESSYGFLKISKDIVEPEIVYLE
jgi:putative phosphoesterase